VRRAVGQALVFLKLAFQLFIFPAEPLFGGLVEGLELGLIRFGMAHSML
jgi:hypothetical protein